MQGHSSGLGARIRHNLGSGHACSYRCNGDDSTVVCGHHCRDELADQAEVAEDVDFEDFRYGGFGRGEDGETGGCSGVVDEDCGVAESGADGGGGGGDGRGEGDIAVEVVDVGGCQLC